MTATMAGIGKRTVRQTIRHQTLSSPQASEKKGPHGGADAGCSGRAEMYTADPEDAGTTVWCGLVGSLRFYFDEPEAHGGSEGAS